jgi:hypothetical protein
MSIVETVVHRHKLRQERHGWNTGTVALAAHCPPNMPLLTELGWRPGSRLLQICHSYGVALPRTYSTGHSEEPSFDARVLVVLLMLC